MPTSKVIKIQHAHFYFRPDLYRPEAIQERQKSFALFEINSTGKMKASHLKNALDYIGMNIHF